MKARTRFAPKGDWRYGAPTTADMAANITETPIMNTVTIADPNTSTVTYTAAVDAPAEQDSEQLNAVSDNGQSRFRRWLDVEYAKHHGHLGRSEVEVMAAKLLRAPMAVRLELLMLLGVAPLGDMSKLDHGRCHPGFAVIQDSLADKEFAADIQLLAKPLGGMTLLQSYRALCARFALHAAAMLHVDPKAIGLNYEVWPASFED